jgi:hypothetical protein
MTPIIFECYWILLYHQNREKQFLMKVVEMYIHRTLCLEIIAQKLKFIGYQSYRTIMWAFLGTVSFLYKL